MKRQNKETLSLNDLALYSEWPARLLSIDFFRKKEKNHSEIVREFGNDKWGKLLDFFEKESSFLLSDVENMEKDLNKIIPCYDHSIGFYLTQSKLADLEVLQYYKKALSKYVENASCLVELGAGYGNKIFKLSEDKSFKHLDLYAAEYTDSGCDLISLISKNINKNINVGKCDFNNLTLSGIKIPENSIIFTSYAVHYVPELKLDFVKFLDQFKPIAVIHFEPCYEYFDEKTTYGLMCKRYMDLNGYTKNIATSIQDGCKKISANFTAHKNIHGSNPFLPFSIIEWSP